MEKPLFIKLHIISPVHIGCDDVYEPTSFVIDEISSKLIEFDPIEFIKSLSHDDRKQFIALCDEGTISSIVGIYKFIANRKVSKNREIDIVSELVPHYKKIKALSTGNEKKVKQELNRFAISRTAYNPHNNMPYIPGSSIKGSLRTAYLSMIAEKTGTKKWPGKAKELEIKLLNGSFDKDPFRMVKVSDLMPVGDVRTKIVYAINKKKKISKFEARGPFQIFEIIKSYEVFEGVINIQEPDQKANISKKIEREKFLESINEFYKSILEDETRILKEINVESMVRNKVIEKFNGKLGKSAFLIRIGRHSGAEAVTIEGNRNIKIMQGKGHTPKFLDHATTIWLASEASKPKSNNDLVPFGWAVMEVFDKPIELKIDTPVIEQKEPPNASIEIVTKEEDEKLIDKFISNIKLLTPTDAGRIGTLIDTALEQLETEEDKRKFAQVLKEHLGKAFKKSKARKKLESFLG